MPVFPHRFNVTKYDVITLRNDDVQPNGIYGPASEPTQVDAPELSAREVDVPEVVMTSPNIHVSTSSGCLPAETTAEVLRELFAPHCNVLSVRRDPSWHYAFVNTASVTDARQACAALVGTRLRCGEQLVLRPSLAKGGPASEPQLTSGAPAQHLMGIYGPGSAPQLAKHQTQCWYFERGICRKGDLCEWMHGSTKPAHLHRGWACHKCGEFGHVILDCPLNRAAPRPSSSSAVPAPQARAPSPAELTIASRVLVSASSGPLPADMSREDVQQLFARHCKVLKVKRRLEKEHAIVHTASPGDAQRACAALDGMLLPNHGQTRLVLSCQGYEPRHSPAHASSQASDDVVHQVETVPLREMVKVDKLGCGDGLRQIRRKRCAQRFVLARSALRP